MDLWLSLVLGLAHKCVDRQDGQAESSACICLCTLKAVKQIKCRIVRGVIGAILGAFKPELDGVSLQKDAVALHEAAVKEMTSRNCILQV